MDLTLVLQDVAITRGGRRVLEGVSVSVSAGEALVLRGRNGAGKSTLLRAMAGLLPLEAGTIAVAGKDADPEAGPGAHAHVQGHLDALKSSLTVAENLAFWQRFYGPPGRSIDDALDAVALEGLADLPASFLSQGQRRRLALARLLVAARPIWLLDEPTAALDTASEARLLGLVEEHRTAGGLVIIASHAPLALATPRHLDLTPVVDDAGDAANTEAGL